MNARFSLRPSFPLRPLRVLGLLAPLFLPARAHAAAGGTAGFAWEALNLALLVGVLIYFARKPARAYLAERRGRIAQGIEQGEQLLRDARERLAQWRGRTQGLDAEAQRIREATRRGAEGEAQSIVARAEAAAQRIESNAEAVARRELRQAQDALRRETALRAAGQAEQLLREQVSAADQSRLFDEFIAALESGGESGVAREGGAG
ncbi:MAG: ATP synthase F0 subunit B [Deltaproteobacteria bacterium]|nr:ATP synthase F0 subunit B [Deltaproteobacteria bacterium]